MTAKLSSLGFYGQYHGHPLADLATLHAHLRAQDCGDAIAWLAGDSSLDNKHWLGSPLGKMMRSTNAKDVSAAPRRYAEAFEAPALAVEDVAYWMNHHLEDQQTGIAALNCAVEESTLRDRAESLLPHDAFIRDNLRANDVLVVSVGGNDVVLKPDAGTLLATAFLNYVVPTCMVGALPDACLGRLRTLFKDETKRYIEALCSKTAPRLVVVCMYYYPCAAKSDRASWADRFLNGIGYSETNAHHLHRVIDHVYGRCTSRLAEECMIKIDGSDESDGDKHITKLTNIMPLALSGVLDWKDERDYVERVEPSSRGGEKIARRLVEIII